MINPPVEDFATDFDHTDEAWVADPYPIMDDLREPALSPTVIVTAASGHR